MTRNSILAAVGASVVALGLAGWTAASTQGAPAGRPASDGRRLEVRYEVRREPAYTPPAVSDATRLDVLDPTSPTVIEQGVLSAQAGQALRDLQAEDDARNAAALAVIRAQDARIDREAAAALSAGRDGPDATAEPPARTAG